MKKLIIWILAALFFVGIGALYGGIGWCVAWILEAGLGVAVNYNVFVWVGVGIFLLKAIPIIIFKFFVDSTIKDISTSTRDSGMKIGKSMKSVLGRIERKNVSK